MYDDDPKNDRAELAARRAARKKARRTEKARRAAAIEAAWVQWLWQPTPAERAAEAEREAETAVEQTTIEWPADLPRPGPGRRFPSPRMIVKWLGAPIRQYTAQEITALVSAWAYAAREAGLEVNATTARGRTLPPSLRPECPEREV